MRQRTYTVCPLCSKKGVYTTRSGLFYLTERCRCCKHERTIAKLNCATREWHPFAGKWYQYKW